jgi:hypothetical protein
MRQPAVSWIILRHDDDSKRLRHLLKGKLCFRQMFTKNPVYLVPHHELQGIRRAGIEFGSVVPRSASETPAKNCLLVIRGTPPVQKNKSAR